MFFIFLLLSDLIFASEFYSLEGKKVLVAGSGGMLGGTIIKKLECEKCQILTLSHADLDLTDMQAVRNYFSSLKPDVIFLSAAYVGGIMANIQNPAKMIGVNLQIETNVIHAAYEQKCEKLIFVSSAAIYPEAITRPIKESDLLTAPLDETKRSYAIAKIAGMELCRSYKKQYGCNFIVGIPNNIYGPKDNFDPVSGHLMSAIIQKVHSAKVNSLPEIELWGTGKAMRELCYVDDVAAALIFLVKFYNGEEPVNIGPGFDYTIEEIARTTCRVIDYKCDIRFNPEKPDGTLRRLLDNTKLKDLGFDQLTTLEDGIKKTYLWFLENKIEKGKEND